MFFNIRNTYVNNKLDSNIYTIKRINYILEINYERTDSTNFRSQI